MNGSIVLISYNLFSKVETIKAEDAGVTAEEVKEEVEA